MTAKIHLWRFRLPGLCSRKRLPGLCSRKRLGADISVTTLIVTLVRYIFYEQRWLIRSDWASTTSPMTSELQPSNHRDNCQTWHTVSASAAQQRAGDAIRTHTETGQKFRRANKIRQVGYHITRASMSADHQSQLGCRYSLLVLTLQGYRGQGALYTHA